MFGLSATHLLILFVVLLFLGPKTLPALGWAVGKGLRNFKEIFGGVKSVMEPEFKKLDQENDRKV